MKLAPRESSRPTPGPVLSAVRRRALKRGLPVSALWEVTRRCPLQCRHCYLAGRPERDDLSTEEAGALLESMARLGVMFLVVSGGEPLVRDDIFSIVDEARRLGFAWKLFTGGTLVDDDCARRIAERLPLDVCISLHGLEETHDSITRVPGSFRAAFGALERLTALGVRVVVKMCLTSAGLTDLSGLRGICETAGAEFRAFSRIYPRFDGALPDDDLRLDEAELAFHHSRCDATALSALGRRRQDEEPICGAGRIAFAVSPGGDVRACAMLKDICGNVRDASLREIWHSDTMAAMRRLTTGDRVECDGCEKGEYCFFCPALAEAERGSLAAAPPSACREAAILRKLAAKGTRAD